MSTKNCELMKQFLEKQARRPATASDGGAEEKNRTFFDVAPNPVCPIHKTFSFEEVFFLNKKSARVSGQTHVKTLSDKITF